MTGVSIGFVDKDDIGVGDGDIACLCSVEHPDINANKTMKGAAVRLKGFNIGNLEVIDKLLFAKA